MHDDVRTLIGKYALCLRAILRATAGRQTVELLEPRQEKKIGCAPGADSDQPGHPLLPCKRLAKTLIRLGG